MTFCITAQLIRHSSLYKQNFLQAYCVLLSQDCSRHTVVGRVRVIHHLLTPLHPSPNTHTPYLSSYQISIPPRFTSPSFPKTPSPQNARRSKARPPRSGPGRSCFRPRCWKASHLTEKGLHMQVPRKCLNSSGICGPQTGFALFATHTMCKSWYMADEKHMVCSVISRREN